MHDGDRIAELEARTLMLEHVATSAWANICRLEADPIAACDRVTAQSLQALANMHDKSVGQANKVFASIIEHEEDFWRMVREQLG